MGILEAENPGLGVAPWAGRHPLLGAYTTAQSGAIQLWDLLLGRLKGSGLCREDLKLPRACSWSQQPPRTMPAAGPSADAGMSPLPPALDRSASSISLLRLLTCFCSGPPPSPQFRVSGLIPAQECNYLSSCPHPGEYKEQTWHFCFSLLAVLPGEVGLDWVPSTGTGAQAPGFSEALAPFPGPETRDGGECGLGAGECRELPGGNTEEEEGGRRRKCR